MEPDIAVIVCTYQMARWSQLLTCLESLKRQSLQPSSVVVVVDGNADVVAALERRNGHERVVAMPRNQGLSAARNAGFAETSTQWIAFLDDDAVADARWLELLYRATQELSAVGAGGWSVADFDPVRPSWLPDELLWTVGCSHRGLPVERTEVRNMFGGCSLLDAHLFGMANGFDPNFGRIAGNAAGGEEADLCRRIVAIDRQAKFAHVPEAKVVHRVGRERMTPAYLLRRCYQEGKAKARMSLSHEKALTPERNFVTNVAPKGVLLAIRAGQPSAALMLAGGVAAAALAYVQVRSAHLLHFGSFATVTNVRRAQVDALPHSAGQLRTDKRISG